MEQTSIILHTEDKNKINKVLGLFRNNKNFEIFLHSKNYVPWTDDNTKNLITSFSKYYAFPTKKELIPSIIELIYLSNSDNILIIGDNTENIPSEKWKYTDPYSLLCNKKEFLKLNLDTKYKELRYFIFDIFYQKKQEILGGVENSPDSSRYNQKIISNFKERIIHIDGGLGDHILALPLLEKLKNEVYVCCKYPHVFEHLGVRGFIHWNDELYGGYNRFVYEYGSGNNSKTIVDAFFEMYGEEKSPTELVKYNGSFIYNTEISKDKKIVLICTSAAKINNQDSNKDWRDIRWFKLVNELKKQGCFVIQVGSKGDNQIPNVDIKLLDKPINELAGLIDEASLWLTVDTFFHHLAASIKPQSGICLTPFYNDHAKHQGVKYIERDCGKNFYDRRWWLDLQQPERKECMDLIDVNSVLEKCKEII